jgi:hypothetical protein
MVMVRVIVRIIVRVIVRVIVIIADYGIVIILVSGPPPHGMAHLTDLALQPCGDALQPLDGGARHPLNSKAHAPAKRW